MSDTWLVAQTLIAGIGTICIFSFLIKENPAYRIFEHIFIGIAAGFGVIYSIKNFLWPNILVPMLGLDIVHYPDGTQSAPYNPLYLLYLVPLLFGLLYYFVYSRKYGWLAKIVIGFSLGISGGIAFKGFFNEMVPQIKSSFRPLVVFGTDGFDILTSLNNAFFVFTLLAVMYYFFFSFRIENRAMAKVSLSGRWLMMICFGAFFGSTVMARMALLVERLLFLITDWWTTLTGLFA